MRGAVGLGASQLTLEVRASNHGAQALYRSFGFVPGGARTAYYADNREDALIMWAHEVDTAAYAATLDALASVGEADHEVIEVPRGPAVAGHPALANHRDERS